MSLENNLPAQFGDDTTLLPHVANIEYIEPKNVKDVGAGDTFLIPEFLSADEANETFEKLLKEIPFQQWFHMNGKEDRGLKPLSRTKCALAKRCANGLMPHYRFPVNDQNRYPVLEINENTPTILSLLEKVNKATGVDYNHLVVLLYKDGDDAIGPHKDKTLDLCEKSPIVSISLGAQRPYVLRETDMFHPTRVQQFDLPNGGLLSLGPKTNTSWFHSIIMLPGQDVKPRISITFRKTETFRNVDTGEVTGKGAPHQTLNWPEKARGNHRLDNYLETPLACAEVLQFWFGNDATEYRGGLWWRGMMEGATGKIEEERKAFTDAYIREKWLPLVEKGVPSRWLETSVGLIGALIVYDQFTRHVFRGTKDAFYNDSTAKGLANLFLDSYSSLFEDVSFSLENKKALMWTFQIFVYFTLIHSEQVADCERGVCGIANLHALLKNSDNPLAIDAANRVAYLFRSSKQHLQILMKFGRYPHRNEALGRESTPEELQFLQSNSEIAWAKSQLPPVKSIQFSASPSSTPVEKKTGGFRILVLHSNRQAVLRFQQRTREVFSKLVGTGGTLVYACAPHKYSARGEALQNMKHLRASESEKTRCWWNASDDPATMIYDGIEETIRYIDNVAAESGPFDGVLGFSQGGALAGLLAALVSQKSPLVANLSKSLQFCVIISGFYIRDTRNEYFTLNGPHARQPVNIPSFHVWGANDMLVTPDRSKALYDSFAPNTNGVLSVNYIHNLDHYSNAIPVWPVDHIHDWIHRNFKPHNASLDKSLPSLLSKIKSGLSIQVCDSLDERIADALKPLSVLCHGSQVDLVYVAILDQPLNRPTTNMVSRSSALLETVVRDYANDNSIDWNAKAKTILLFIPAAISVLYVVNKSLPLFSVAIIDTVSDAIAACLASKSQNIIASLLPNYKNSLIRKSGIIESIVARFSSFHVFYDEKNVDVQRTWCKICAAVDIYIAKENDPGGDKKRESKLRKGMRNPEQLEQLLNAPFSDDIINPRAEPVDLAQQDEFKHLHEFLRCDTTCLSDAAKVFPRGTLTPNRILDLCKRELGSAGVPDLEISLEADGKSAKPKVQSLLLGNNVAGRALGEAVGRMIKKKSTAITTWYISGNDLDEKTILPVMDALEEDDQVVQLWLKRNPLRVAGAFAMQTMLSHNRFINVLDLTNTGLLDAGTLAVFQAIASNEKSAVQYLYLESNGITRASIPKICDLLPKTKIKELCLSGNRVGDAGAELLSTVLHRLEHLKVSSCGIGAKGAQAIAQVLATNTSCKKLDLGFLKSTNVLGEVPNAIGNDGAIALAKALGSNKALLSLVLLHNGIYQKGVAALALVLSTSNNTLLHLNIEQLGLPHDEVTRENIRISLKRNMAALDDDAKEAAQALINNMHLSGIKSVYRNETN